MEIKVLISESASKRQLENAKAAFGSKFATIVSALEEASKEKILSTPGLDALLEALKLPATEFEKVSAKAAFAKAVEAAKVFATSKNYGSKIAALKAIKFTLAAKAPGEVVPPKKTAKTVVGKPNGTPAERAAFRTAARQAKFAKEKAPTPNVKKSNFTRIDKLSDMLELMINDGKETEALTLLNMTIQQLTPESGKKLGPVADQVEHADDMDGNSGLCIYAGVDGTIVLAHKNSSASHFNAVVKSAGLTKNVPSDNWFVYLDKSIDGPYMSEKIVPVKASIAFFSDNDVAGVLKHIKKLAKA